MARSRESRKQKAENRKEKAEAESHSAFRAEFRVPGSALQHLSDQHECATTGCKRESFTGAHRRSMERLTGQRIERAESQSLPCFNL
jgi:hypothetical protein